MDISPDIQQEIDKLRPYFPTEQALLIPLLKFLQKKNGWLSPETLESAATFLHLPLARVEEVVTFYTMFSLKPTAKKNIQICRNISCWLNGADLLTDHLEKRLHIKSGEMTPDKNYSLCEVECLASCGTAPVMQVNEDYYENLSAESLNRLLDGWDAELRKGR